MASDQDDSIKTVVTCEGNISDPDFPIRLSSLLARLRRLLFAGNKPFRVTNVEPWNSVRVTFNIPREAAYRLRLLAQAGDRVLRGLGILSVQIEGDQVISLTIAGRFNEPQEIILQPVDDDQPASSSNSSSFDLGSLEAAASATAVGSSKNISQYMGQSSGGVAGPLVAVASTSTAASVGPEGFANTMAPPPADFKSPNVVAPGSEPIPFPPKGSSSSNPLANIHPHLHHSPSRPHPNAFGPFPFASMTHAMNTMHGSQGHHPVSSAASTTVAVSNVTTTPSPSPSPATSPAATRFTFGAPPAFHHPITTAGHSVTGPFQPVRHAHTSTSSANVAATVAAVAAGGGNISAPPGIVLNNLSRGAVDRANAALMSPLLVNLLQSDMSSGQTTTATNAAASVIVGKHQSQSSSASSSETGTAPVKRKRKPRKPKEKPPSEAGTPATAPSSVGSSPRASPLLCNPLAKTPVSLAATTVSESLSPFAQPHNISTPLTVPSIPLSPPSLTPPSASPPSSAGSTAPPPFITTATDALAAVVSAGKVPSLPPPSHSSFVVGCHHQLHRHPSLQQPQQQPQPLHHHHHRVPPLPSPPPTAPSSSASTSNNSGQSSQEAEHELSPWPSPSPAKRAPQHLVNPFTGQLEPMSSDEEEEEVENLDDDEEDDDFGSSLGEGTHTSSNDGSRTTPLLDSGSSSASSTSSTYSRTYPFAGLSEGGLEAGRRTAESHRLEGAATIGGAKEHNPLSPSVSQTPVTSVGSPGEKIKLRLKLDSKERMRLAPEKPKPAKVDVISASTTAATSHQYKVDVSFVNIPTRRISGGVGGAALSAAAAVTTTVGSGATSPAASGARSGSPTGMLCYGIAGTLSTTPEPRVPPLHISLRGRNAAVVTSPRRGEKSRGGGRGRELGDRPSRGLPLAAKGVGTKTRIARGTGKLEGTRGLVPVSAAISGAGPATFRVATMAGRRASNVRGGVLSRRGRGAANLSSSILSSTSGRVAASEVVSSATSDVEGQLQSSIELSQEHLQADPGRTSTSPPGGSQQQQGRREQTLLSGGSTLVLDSNFSRPPSPPPTSVTTFTTAAQSQHVQVPNVLQPSKNMPVSSATLVSSVQIPRRDSEPTIPATAVVGVPRRRPSLHDRPTGSPGVAPVYRLPTGPLQEGDGGGVSRTKDILRVAADVGSKERGEVLTRFGIKVKNIGQPQRSLNDLQRRHSPNAFEVPLSSDSGLVPQERRVTSQETAVNATPDHMQAVLSGGELPGEEQQRCRPDDRLQPLVVRGVKMVALPEVAAHVAESGGVSSAPFNSPALTVRSLRIADENAVQRSEARSPVVRQIVLEPPKANPHQPQCVSASPTYVPPAPSTSAATVMASEPAASAWNSQRVMDAYYHQHMRHHVNVTESLAVVAGEAASSSQHYGVSTTLPVSRPVATNISDGGVSGLRAQESAQQLTPLGDVTLRTRGVSLSTGSVYDRAPTPLESSAARSDTPNLATVAATSAMDTSHRVPVVPFSQTAPNLQPVLSGEREQSETSGRDVLRSSGNAVTREDLVMRGREAQVAVPFGCRSESEVADSSAKTVGNDVPSVEQWVQQSCDRTNAVDDEDNVTPTVSLPVPISDVEVPCGDAAHAVPTTTNIATTVTAPLVSQIPRGVVVSRGREPILSQEKLRLVGAMAPARQLVSTAVGGDVLLDGVMQVAGHADGDEDEYMTREVTHHHHLHHNRRHHHLHHHILNSATTLPSTAVSIVTVSSSSPCSASPSGSSPDSLNAGTSSEENGDHAASVGRGGNGAGGAIRHRHFHPGSQCNSSGSPYEDSGIESMDATGLEKLTGNESPGDAPDANLSANYGGGHRPAPPLPPPPDPRAQASCSVSRTSGQLPVTSGRSVSGETTKLATSSNVGGAARLRNTSGRDDGAIYKSQNETKEQSRGVEIAPAETGDRPREFRDEINTDRDLTKSDENRVSQNSQRLEVQPSISSTGVLVSRESLLETNANITSADQKPASPNIHQIQDSSVVSRRESDSSPEVINAPMQESENHALVTSGAVPPFDQSELSEDVNSADQEQPILAIDCEKPRTEECQPDEPHTSGRSRLEFSEIDENDSHLLTSVVIHGDHESLDLVSSCFGDAEGLGLGEDDLTCVSPSEETTQLLVFTVEDVDSIVMTENSSELSLMNVTHHHHHHEGTELNENQGTSAANQFSSPNEETSQPVGTADVHLQPSDSLPTVSFSIGRGQKHLENCVDAREGLTVMQVQLSNNAEDDLSDSTAVTAAPPTSNHLSSPTNSNDDHSAPSQRNSCSLSSAGQGAPTAIQFVSLPTSGAGASQMMAGGHGGSEENGDVAVTMPPTTGLFQSVSPVKLVMSRLRHQAISCASCTSSTVTLTTVLVKSQGGQNSQPPCNTTVVAASQAPRPSAHPPHFAPTLVPLNALSPATVMPAPPLMRLGLPGAGGHGAVYCSPDSVPPTSATIVTPHTAPPPSIEQSLSASAAPVVKTEGCTDTIYTSPVDSCAPSRPYPGSSGQEAHIPIEGGRRRDSTGSESDTSGSVLSGASCDGLYRRPPHQHDGSRDDDDDEEEEEDEDSYSRNMSITSGDHNYIFRASRTPPAASTSRERNRGERQRPPTAASDGSDESTSSVNQGVPVVTDEMVGASNVEEIGNVGGENEVGSKVHEVADTVEDGNSVDHMVNSIDHVVHNTDSIGDTVNSDVDVTEPVVLNDGGNVEYTALEESSAVADDSSNDNNKENAVAEHVCNDIGATATTSQENGPVNSILDDDVILVTDAVSVSDAITTDNEVVHSEDEEEEIEEVERNAASKVEATVDDLSLEGGDSSSGGATFDSNGKFESLTIEIPLDLEVERRSTRSTRSSSRLSSPGSGSRQPASAGSPRPNSRAPPTANNDSDVTVPTESAVLRTLPARSAAKRKREDSDSETERRKARSSTPALVLSTNATGPLTPVSLDRDGGGLAGSAVDLVGTEVDPPKGPSPTDAAANQFFTKPVKRKCSENAVELIKACIGIDDTPKRMTGNRLSLAASGHDSGRVNSNRAGKGIKDDGSKSKGLNSASGVSEESSDDEVTLSELVTKVRSTKSRPATSHAEERSVTRNSKQRHNAVHSEEEDALATTGATPPGVKGEKAATCRINSRRDDGRRTLAGGAGAIQRESRKDERISMRLGGRIVAEKGRRGSSPPPPPPPPSSKGPEKANHRAKAKEERVATPPLNAKEEPDGKRKLRSSGSSGYYDSLPQKRRRFSRDHR